MWYWMLSFHTGMKKSEPSSLSASRLVWLSMPGAFSAMAAKASVPSQYSGTMRISRRVKNCGAPSRVT